MIRLNHNEWSGNYPDPILEQYRYYDLDRFDRKTDSIILQLASSLRVSPAWINIDFGGIEFGRRMFFGLQQIFQKPKVFIPTLGWHYYHRFADMCRVEIEKAPVLAEIPSIKRFRQSPPYLSSEVDVAVIVSPSTPDGSFICTRDLIRYARDHWDTLIFVDATYHEFSSEPYDFRNILDRCENIAFCWSLSKSYGIPGARVGVFVTSSRTWRSIIGPDPFLGHNTASISAVETVLKNRDFFEKERKTICERRDMFLSRLSSMKNFTGFYSDANFFLIKSDLDMFAVSRWLFDLGIMVRYLPAWDKFIRVSVGTEEELEGLYRELRRIDDGEVSIPEGY